jgi:glyoxylase-like metal-dependent hydrolase (beta-lactamase superfamily II)
MTACNVPYARFSFTRLPRPLVLAASAILCAVLVAGCAAPAAQQAGTIQRLYVFNCGEAHIKDLARWSPPGVNAGKRFEFSDNCYLIQHAHGMMLWDSGFSEAIADLPDGVPAAGGVITAKVPKKLSAQLAEIGVAPAQVTRIAFSHSHSDHVGNANLFAGATLYIQKAEFDAAFGPEPGKYNFAPATYEKLRSTPMKILEGDYDVFGDGSVTIISTPGHTPGHQSLLVRLPKTGAIVLSGDLAHFEENWKNRFAPGFNYDPAQTVVSMNKVAALLEANHATLWINHDKAQTDRIAHAPAFIE